MSIPSVKTIESELGLSHTDARMVRKAMVWEDTGGWDKSLNMYFQDLVYFPRGDHIWQAISLYGEDRYASKRSTVALAIINRILNTDGIESVGDIEYCSTDDREVTVMYDYSADSPWIIESLEDLDV